MFNSLSEKLESAFKNLKGQGRSLMFQPLFGALANLVCLVARQQGSKQEQRKGFQQEQPNQ